MQSEIDRFFAVDVAGFARSLADLDRRLGPSTEARMDDSFAELHGAMYRSGDACHRLESRLEPQPALLKEVQARFRSEICPWLDRSWFMHRARTKPRGYPGDYELLAAIYDNVPKSLGLGGYLDLTFLDSTLGRAVRARLQAARTFLIEELARRRGEVSILNVACGPCREYADGLGDLDHHTVRVTCIDNDRQALDYVQARVTTLTPATLDVSCVCYNALRMSSAKANIRQFGRPDVIYSVGLCDYIPDKFLVAMLRGWRESLQEGGVVYAAFKDARRYDKTLYQWHVDWYFLQRTEDDCRRLFEQAGYDMNGLTMSRDATGVIMNFVSRAGAPARLRIDAPAVREQGQTAPTLPPHVPQSSDSPVP